MLVHLSNTKLYQTHASLSGTLQEIQKEVEFSLQNKHLAAIFDIFDQI